jgi:hypothetical protein
MNHLKIYEAIIAKVKSENRFKLKKDQEGYTYYEHHHIIPKCIGGTNDKKNLILLTAREHYICHKLLTYIYKGNKKIADAFFLMSVEKNNRNFNISSRDYAYAKELKALIPISKETREKLSKTSYFRLITKEKRKNMAATRKKNDPESYRRFLKINASNFNKIYKTGKKQSKESIESIEKRKNALTGRVLSEKHKQNLRKPRSEQAKQNMKKPHKPMSIQQKNNISYTLKGRPKSEKAKQNMRKPKSKTARENMKKAQEIRRQKEKKLKNDKLTKNLSFN